MSAFKICRASLPIILAASGFVSAAEEKPKTLAEAKAAFAKADRALNEAWTAAKKALPEPEYTELQIKQVVG